MVSFVVVTMAVLFAVLMWLVFGFLILCWMSGEGLLEDEDLLFEDEPGWWAGLLNFALWPYVVWQWWIRWR